MLETAVKEQLVTEDLMSWWNSFKSWIDRLSCRVSIENLLRNPRDINKLIYDTEAAIASKVRNGQMTFAVNECLDEFELTESFFQKIYDIAKKTVTVPFSFIRKSIFSYMDSRFRWLKDKWWNYLVKKRHPEVKEKDINSFIFNKGSEYEVDKEGFTAFIYGTMLIGVISLAVTLYGNIPLFGEFLVVIFHAVKEIVLLILPAIQSMVEG
jgi:hypothetical protein